MLLNSASLVFGQSLSVVDLTRMYHMSPDKLPAFMKEKDWDGNTTTMNGNAFDMSWQYNNAEDIVVKQDEKGLRSISYRLHKEADIEAYKNKNGNFDSFEKLISNKKNVEIYRHKNILQMLTTNTTKGILTIRYEVHPDVAFWTALIDANSKDEAYAVGTYLAEEGGVVIGHSPDSAEVYVVALEDLKRGNGCSWSSKKGKVPGCFISNQWSKANYDYAGRANTKAICAYVEGEQQLRAAQLAVNYEGGNHRDWYVPSIAQLKMIADNKVDIDASLRQNGGISIAKMWYWSSSQYNDTMVWAYNFATLILGHSAKDGHDRVRAVRTVKLR
ncbi:MAG: DUF1566 domain-containing protein [Paludibacteraceae bacterium]|nr:DUF1566 domain-containing protein [Paludibacteraceae bacterium]